RLEPAAHESRERADQTLAEGQCKRKPKGEGDEHRPQHQPQHARMQKIRQTVEQRADNAHRRKVSHSFASRFADTGTCLLSSCAKRDTRSSSSSQPNWTHSAGSWPRLEASSRR